MVFQGSQVPYHHLPLSGTGYCLLMCHTFCLNLSDQVKALYMIKILIVGFSSCTKYIKHNLNPQSKWTSHILLQLLEGAGPQILYSAKKVWQGRLWQMRPVCEVLTSKILINWLYMGFIGETLRLKSLVGKHWRIVG